MCNDVYVWFGIEGENYEALSLSLSCTRGQIGVCVKKRYWGGELQFFHRYFNYLIFFLRYVNFTVISQLLKNLSLMTHIPKERKSHANNSITDISCNCLISLQTIIKGTNKCLNQFFSYAFEVFRTLKVHLHLIFHSIIEAIFFSFFSFSLSAEHGSHWWKFLATPILTFKFTLFAVKISTHHHIAQLVRRA